MASADVHEFTDTNFDAEVLKSNQPVLVDFWATWCAPCVKLGPTIEEIAAKYKGKVKVGKVNIDQHSDAAMKYNIRSIPTVLIFKDGAVQKQFVGLVPKADFETSLNSMVG
ncbi:MAG: thioredoxin [Phycisphaerales bacterium]|nr:thioredoxin [Phycisphaerales bacterium]